MASIVSTTRPYGLDNGSNVSTNSASINTNTGDIAVNGLSNTLSSKKEKSNYQTPGINIYNSSTSQQAVTPETAHDYKPHVVYENRYLNNATTVNNNNLSTTDRNNLSILNKWGNKLRATQQANNVTTYMNDPSTVPLTRRNVHGFFETITNENGKSSLGTVGVRIGDNVYGKWTLIEDMDWDPIRAYDIGMPIMNYAVNFNNYDTKNKIIQSTLAYAHSYSNYYNGQNNFVDDYAIKEWGNLVDMSVNWRDRNSLQNAMAGLNTVSGLSQRYGLNEYFGGDKVVGGIQNAAALYTFGNSLYQLGNNWGTMSTSEKAAASFNTINSGIIAYQSGAPFVHSLFNSGSAASAGSVGTGATAGNAASAGSGYAGGGSLAGKGAYQGATTSTTAEVANEGWLSTTGKVLPWIGVAIAGYQNNKFLAESSGVHEDKIMAFGPLAAGLGSGRNTAEDRKNGAISGASAGAATGAAIGSIIPVLGTAVGAVIGALVGATIGTIQNSGKFGHSREQYHRGIYREALGQTGIFEKAAKGTEHHGHFYYQLADGQYYNVGIDGHSGRASDINGKIKTVYDQSQILDRDMHNSEKIDHEIRPYDVDYTCNMDYTGSLMLAPLNALGLGGSNIEDAAEYNQMLGYMTNACTSNVGRDMTRDNFDKMVSNIKAGYERVGITNKEDAQNALALSYMQGNVTDEDMDSFKLALNLLYNKNGYDQAMSLMDQLGRDTSQKEIEKIGKEQSTEETIPETTNTKTEPVDVKEMTIQTKNTPTDFTEVIDTQFTQEGTGE